MLAVAVRKTRQDYTRFYRGNWPVLHLEAIIVRLYLKTMKLQEL
jgi:hypothetical protein